MRNLELDVAAWKVASAMTDENPYLAAIDRLNALEEEHMNPDWTWEEAREHAHASIRAEVGDPEWLIEAARAYGRSAHMLETLSRENLVAIGFLAGARTYAMALRMEAQDD